MGTYCYVPGSYSLRNKELNKRGNNYNYCFHFCSLAWLNVFTLFGGKTGNTNIRAKRLVLFCSLRK